MASGSGKSKGSSSKTTLFGALALITIVLTIVASLQVSTWERYEAEYLLRAAEQRVVSREITSYALQASSGITDAFPMLQDARDHFEALMEQLREGDALNGLPPSPEVMKADLDNMDNTWQGLRERADEIIASRDAVLTVGKLRKSNAEIIPQVVRVLQEAVRSMVENKATQQQVSLVTELLHLAQRVGSDANAILDGGDATRLAIEEFHNDIKRFNKGLEQLQNGDSAIGVDAIVNDNVVSLLAKAGSLFATINNHADELTLATPTLLPAMAAAERITVESDRVNEVSARLISSYAASPGLWKIGQFQIGSIMVTMLGGLSLFFLALLAWGLIAGANQRQREMAEQNERNQQAILRLLDEMGDLADGDLTVTATVSEDITGAIADSINYAIEALRSLVTTINETSVQVAAAAQESRATAMHLADASEHQAEQIASATESVVEMTSALEDLASDSNESAEVAQRSVEIASKGSNAVHNTIRGMDNIREQIQETSKRIKRLGESSQQIGEIVELIDDIADQTNILALNAAMQAAMAGEAGRGFAVVADEVQRLAERSSSATRQIEALVKTIQADTNEAVSSMETSTHEVVSGAQLAEGAGDALKEIENVSNYIAEITRKMASSAKLQADGAMQVKTNMAVIEEITAQAREGTSQAATSIGTLAEMSDQLNRSVAGFRLPR
jgi:twitching motility protein PilJ